MTRINTNVASLRALRSTTGANNLLGTSLERLSTGLKINSGKDNPAGLIASETLRSQISSIEQSIKNSNRANNVISTADTALGEIGGLLTQIRGLVQEGLNDGALSQSEIEANQLQIDAALSAINRISSNTSFAGDKLIDGSKAFTTSISTADAAKITDLQVNEAVIGTASSISLDATIDTVAEKASVLYQGGDFTSGATIEVGGSKGNEVVFLGDSATVENVRDAINGVSDSTGVEAAIRSGVTLAAGDLTVGAGNAAVTFVRNQAGDATDVQGTVSVVLADPASASSALSIDTVTDADTGDTVITVNLATDANSAITTTAAQLETALDGDADASALIDTIAGGDGSGTVAAAASADLSEATLQIDDIRGENADGAISIVFADPSANSQALSIATSTSGDDTTITVSLATDANGALTSTLADVITALQGETTETLADGTTTVADALDVRSATGSDNTTLVRALASTNLDATNGTTLELRSAEYGSAESVNINVLDGSFATTDADYTTVSSADTGVDIAVTINGQSAYGRGLDATLRTSTLDATISFAEASNVADESASISITGGGSLFQIGQEVSPSGQIGIGIEAVNTARLGGITGKLFELGTGKGKSLLDVGQGGVSGETLVSIIEQSITRVSSLRGRLGAVQANVIDTNISTLGVALENISEARSQIVDTDFAEETAQLTKAQILSQSAISVLAIANQNPQQVLSLLG
ncbi:flagellin N-terminal helical domain-containing protein [Stratiformator vulcanicus]|uniref:Flagellin n=1 Tax=Stratiformator vulcanicus TaxID=2527980 RepID=A0A517QZ58_9PLAN|nr:flagellin [Stratiformator vulcanicus]QDT36935.1 Flagellin D [Stratiformator vulcanicus]